MGCRSTIWREAALLSSLPDETPEGRSIVVLAHDRYHVDGHRRADRRRSDLHSLQRDNPHERRRSRTESGMDARRNRCAKARLTPC